MAPSKSLKKRLRHFLNRMASGGVGPLSKLYPWFSRGRHLVALNESEATEFYELVDLLLKQLAPHDEVSEDTVTSVLGDAMFAMRTAAFQDLTAHVEAVSAQVLSKLGREVKQWGVYFPVVGVYDDCLPFTIGDVSFFPRDQSLSDKVVPSGTTDVDGMHAIVRRHARRDIDEHFNDSPWVQVKVDAIAGDSAAATNLAVAKLELTLDVINFFSDLFRPREYRARVEVGPERQPVLLVSCAVMSEDEATGVGRGRIGALDDVWLPQLDSEDARKMGLDRAHVILASRARTEVEERLLAALRWGGRGTTESRLPDRFLFYMMAFESAVKGPRQINKIAKTIGSRAMQLFRQSNAATHYSPEIQRLYKLRSQLVHTGWADIADEDVMSARYHAKETTVRLLTMKEFVGIETNKELDDWFAPL